MIDFAYNQYNEIGKKTVSMQRQEGHSQMKDKSSALIKRNYQLKVLWQP